MARMKILAGDFGKTQGSFYGPPGQFVITTGKWGFGSERIPFADVASIEAATEDSVKRAAGTIGWGAAGAIALGPVGLLAGLLLGGNAKETAFVCVLNDGRKFMASIDSKAFTKMLASKF